MSFIKKILSPVYFGLGASKFSQDKFEEAIPFFEKVLDVERKEAGKEQLFSCLGRCYYHAGRLSESMKFLSMAYNLYKKKDISNFCEHNRRDLLNMLEIFEKVLVYFGETEYAQQVNYKIKEINRVIYDK
uniref:tetratricopeptide repeat protein n=1 Tax=Candidatus Electrothrix sp. TaxID=2170559 RepID=UPI004056D651